MTKRWLDALLSAHPALRPARALLSPVWLGALAVLGINDHLLKGAGVLPGVVTGKLSDLAGMLVAPALLAALLGVKTRRGLLYCHIAVGLVFALINVSPACADAWSWLMSLVGFPWAITVDPTDLLALPALALGWRLLTPAMAEPVSSDIRPRAISLPSRPRWESVPQAGAAAVGALLCVATSPSQPGNGWEEPFYQPIAADVYLHNSSAEFDIAVRVRELRDDVDVDCHAIAKDPGLLFSEPLFGEGVTWNIPPGANVPARGEDSPRRDCYAVLLGGDSFPDTILFWRDDEIPYGGVPGQHESEDEYGPGAVILTADDDGVASIAGSERDIVFPHRNAPEDAYVSPPDFHRVAWTEPPAGTHRLLELEVGIDGCAAFTFSGVSSRFYLCTPLTELPFEPPQWVKIEDYGDLLVLSPAPDPGEPAPVIPPVKIGVSRGADLPYIAGTTLAAKPLHAVEYGPEPECGTVALPQEIVAEFGDEAVTLRAGESATLHDGQQTLTLHSVHAERRIIVATDCAEGPDVTGDDLELVYVWTESSEP